MKTKLPKSNFFTVVMLLFAFVDNGNAQYTITGNVNSSTLSCATFAGNTIIYVGNGTTSSSLIMDSNLDLTLCTTLGAIQFIIRNNSALVFPDKSNYNLNLPTGSSIVVETGSPGGNIATVGSCSNSDLIKIGGVNIASCQGAGLRSFDEIVALGGYNTVKTSVNSVCGVDGFIIAASVIPEPSIPTTYKLYSLLNGQYTLIKSVISSSSPYSANLSTPAKSAITSFYIEASSVLLTTPKREVVVKRASATWNGTVLGWLDNIAPSVDSDIIFKGAYTASDNMVGCSCEVQSGAVTIPSGKTLTLTNELKVTGGSLTFENTASLVQTNNVINSGVITYKRQTTPIGKFDYTYWSSPVDEQKLINVSPNTLGDKFYSFNANGNN